MLIRVTETHDDDDHNDNNNNNKQDLISRVTTLEDSNIQFSRTTRITRYTKKQPIQRAKIKGQKMYLRKPRCWTY